MSPRIFALWGGIAMIVVAALAFFVPGSMNGLPPLMIENSYGLFLGLIPMNIINKAALVIVGLMGIYSAFAANVELPRSKWYSRSVMLLMGLLTVLGLIPETNTLFGYWPLFGGNIVFYAAVGLVAAFYGFALTSRVPADRTGKHMTRESLAH